MTPARSDSSPVIEVAAGLVFRQGKLLITQRRAEDHLGGLWEFPGGKKEPGESFETCLQRELHEELGILVEPQELLTSILHHYPGKTVQLKFFRCLWREQEPRALGCQAYAWIQSSQLDDYPFPEADAQLVEMLKHTPSLWGFSTADTMMGRQKPERS